LNKFKRNLAAGIAILVFGVVLVHSMLIYRIVPDSYATYFNVAFTLIFSIIIIELVSRGMQLIGSKALKEEGSALSDLFRVIAYTIVAITILYELKVNVTGLLVGAGFLGIVLGLAAQNTLGNILAGFEIMATKPFKIGDMVKVSTWQYGNIASTWPHGLIVPGFEGKVEKVGLVYASLLGPDNIRTYIPNGILIQALVINYERSATMHMEQRVELLLAKSFDDFKAKMNKSMKSLPQPMRSKISGFDIEIADINSTFYGVSLKAEVPVKQYSEISKIIKEKSLEAIASTKQA
jgi:small-conductance mechanosensitive channel